MVVENLEETSIRDRDYFMIIWHQKISLFANLLVPKKLHYPASLHTVNIRLLCKVPEQTVSESCEKKGKILIDEIANVKRIKVTLESCDTTLRKDPDVLSLKWENKQDPVEIVKLVKSNSFRKTAIENEKAISKLKEPITKLENDLKNV